jgi:hypothetical protein
LSGRWRLASGVRSSHICFRPFLIPPLDLPALRPL